MYVILSFVYLIHLSDSFFSLCISVPLSVFLSPTLFRNSFKSHCAWRSVPQFVICYFKTALFAFLWFSVNCFPFCFCLNMFVFIRSKYDFTAFLSSPAIFCVSFILSRISALYYFSLVRFSFTRLFTYISLIPISLHPLHVTQPYSSLFSLVFLLPSHSHFSFTFSL